MSIKNNFSLFVLFFSLFSILSAQKVKLSDVDVKAQFMRLAPIGFQSDISSFYVDVSGNERFLESIGYSSNIIKNSINIAGYKRIDQTVGAQVVLPIVGPSSSGVKHKTEDKKNKEGKTWKEYSADYDFSASCMVKVIDPKKNILMEYLIEVSNRTSTQAYKTKAEVDKYVKDNNEKINKEGLKGITKKLIDDINTRLRIEFSVTPDKDKVEFYTIKTKDHPEFDEYAKMNELIENAFIELKANDNSIYKTKIQPLIEFWTKKEPTYSGSDKEQIKLKYACQMNLANAYFWSEDFDNAKKYANLVQNGKENPKDGKKLIEKIEKVQNYLNKSGRTTRFFNIEMSSEEIEKVEILQKEKEERISKGELIDFPDFNSKVDLKSHSKVKKGIYYSSSGKVDTGYFVFENNADFPDFRDPKGIRFAYLKDGKIELGTPNYGKTKALQIGDDHYEVKDVKVKSIIGSTSMSNAIVEVINDFERTQVVMIHPPYKYAKTIGSSGEELKPDLFVYNKANNIYHPTDGLTGPSQALIKIVEDCPKAKELAEKNKEEMKKNSLLTRLAGLPNVEAIIMVLKEFDNCK